MKSVFSFIILFSCSTFFSQIVKGEIVDMKSGVPVPFSAVTIYKDSLLVNGSVSDIEGSFTVQLKDSGKFIIQVRSLGFETFKKQITVNKDINIGKIKLESDNNKLKDLVIEDFQSLSQNGVDKRVYNVNDAIKDESINASDILEKIPMIEMDLDGNPNIVGKNGVIVLVDGKQSRVQTNDLATTLRLIPSENIVKVEVMTNPPLKYRSGGKAVINIVTNQAKQKGYKLSAHGRASTDTTYSGGLNFTYKYDFISLYGYFGRYEWMNLTNSNSNRNNLLSSSEFINKTNSTSYWKGNGLYYGGGAEIDINDKNTIAVFVSSGNHGNNGNTSIESNISDVNNLLTDDLILLYGSNSSSNYFNTGFDYDLKFKNPEQELSINYNYSENSAEETDFSNSEGIKTFSNYSLENPSNSKSNSHSVFGSYFQPIDSTSNLETTISYNLSNSLSEKQFFTEINNVLVEDTSLYNLFEMNASTLNLSSTYTKSIKKTTIKLGGSYTLSALKATSINNTYNYFEPSLKLFQKVSDNHEIGISYTYSYQVPFGTWYGGMYLNPVIDNSDRRNVSSGNTDIQPERSHNLELTHNTFINKFNLGSTIYYNSTDNSIMQVKTVDSEGVSTSKYENLGYDRDFGARLSSSGTIKKVRLNISSSIFYSELKSPYSTANAFSYRVSSMAFFKLPFKVSSRLSLSYRGPSTVVDGVSEGYFQSSFGLSKSIVNNSIKISFSMRDIFNTVETYSIFKNNTYSNQTYSKGFTQKFMLRVNINLGKLKDLPQTRGQEFGM